MVKKLIYSIAGVGFAVGAKALQAILSLLGLWGDYEFAQGKLEDPSEFKQMIDFLFINPPPLLTQLLIFGGIFLFIYAFFLHDRIFKPALAQGGRNVADSDTSTYYTSTIIRHKEYVELREVADKLYQKTYDSQLAVIARDFKHPDAGNSDPIRYYGMYLFEQDFPIYGKRLNHPGHDIELISEGQKKELHLVKSLSALHSTHGQVIYSKIIVPKEGIDQRIEEINDES